MPLNIWQELANSAPRPAPRRRVLRKPRGVYTKGPVRSDRTPVRRAASPAPRRTSVAPSYRPPARTASVASSGGHSPGGGGSAGGPMPTGVGASLLAQLRKVAGQQIGLELDPQIAARHFARKEAWQSYQSETGQVRKNLGLTTTELTHLYGALDALLQRNTAQRTQAMDTARSATTSAYDTLASQVGQNYAGAQAATGTEAARLGQDAGGAQARLTADQAFATGQVGAQRAAATSTIDAIKAAAAAEGSQLRGAAQATGPMLIGQARVKADSAISELLRAFKSDERRLNFEVRQLEGSRKAKVEQLVREMQAAEEQRQQDMAQLQFMNSIRAGQLGIAAGQLDLAKQRLSADIANNQNNQVLRAKELQAKLAGKAAGPQTGPERAYSYLQSGYRGGVPQLQLQQALEDAINGNSNDPGWRPGQGTPGYDPKFLDQYLRDISMAVGQRGWTNAELSALRNAAHYYFRR